MEILRTPPTRLRYRRWDHDVYETAAHSAGFTPLTWHPAAIPQHSVDKKGAAYWQAYRDNPFLAAFETCVPEL